MPHHYDYYFCYASGNNVPNIAPLIDTTQPLRNTPIVILATTTMNDKSKQLQSVMQTLTNSQVQVTIKNIADDAQLNQFLLDFLSSAEYEGKTILFNITGGTASMSLTAFLTGLNLGNNPPQVHYLLLDQSNNQKQEIFDTNGTITPSLDHQYQLKIKDYLTLYNTTITGNDKAHDRKCNLFINFFNDLNSIERSQFSDMFNELNKICYYDKQNPSANDNYISRLRYDLPKDSESIYTLLDKLVEFQIIDPNWSAEYKIVFANEEYHKFCTGTWLELFVFKQIEALKKEYPNLIYDLSMGLRVAYGDKNKNDHNELDIIFTANTKAYYIECKTGRQVARNYNDIIEKNGYLANKLYIKTKIFTNDNKTNIIKHSKGNDLNKLNTEKELMTGEDLINPAQFRAKILKWIS